MALQLREQSLKQSALLKKHLEVIASRIVEKYPQSFKDEIEGNVVGSGHDSLWKQQLLLSRVENCYRKIEHAPRKRPAPKDSSASISEALEKARQQQMASYGCITFNTTELPDGETEETLLAVKEKMKDAFKNAVHVDVDALMQKTFILQRRDIINTLMSVPDLHKEWPYLFNKAGMTINFYQLVGIDIGQAWWESTQTSVVKPTQKRKAWDPPESAVFGHKIGMQRLACLKEYTLLP
ncbi:hypothetical protein GQR58_019555 [Nymphon striatum]|nr:hypothetical protein GQR58_019555 [Nymphon striatum]